MSLTRRDTLRTLPAGLFGAPARSRTLRIGIATTEFREYTNERLARELSEQGLRTIQLFFTQTDSNYWKYGGRSSLPGLTPERAREIAGIYRSRGIEIHSLGVYTTLVHGDSAERAANLDYFEAMMKIGGHMGVRKFITEAGHYQPEGPAPRVPYDFQDEVWSTFVATGKALARRAEAHGATVLFEPIYRSVLASAKRTRLFLEEVGSPRLRALLDPANLLEVSDLEEMFAQLDGWIDCVHAKDRKLHVTAGVHAGKGDLDYGKLVRLAAEKTPAAPMIVEYAGSKTYRDALAHLRAAMRQAGIGEA